jgi:hypothetical protein
VGAASTLKPLETLASSLQENASAGLVKLRWKGATALPVTDEELGSRPKSVWISATVSRNLKVLERTGRIT